MQAHLADALKDRIATACALSTPSQIRSFVFMHMHKARHNISRMRADTKGKGGRAENLPVQ